MKLEHDQLEKIAMFIDGEGFRYIEEDLREFCRERNNLSRVAGNSFEDGKLVGIVYGMGLLLGEIDMIREETRKMAKEKK